jgi:hypothetical protein
MDAVGIEPTAFRNHKRTVVMQSGRATTAPSALSSSSKHALTLSSEVTPTVRCIIRPHTMPRDFEA